MRATRLGAFITLAMTCVVLFGGCASTTGSAASGGERQSGRCASALAPSANGLAEVLDSAAVQERLEALWPDEGGLAVARLAGRESDSPRPVQVWSEALAADEREAVVAVLMEHYRVPAESEGSRYLFLGDETGPALRRVDRLGQCAPTIISREPIARRIAAEARGLGIDQMYRVRLYAFVEASGRIREVRIAESSGDARVDQAAARVFRGERMTPGMIEGMRVPLWVAFPVTFRPR